MAHESVYRVRGLAYSYGKRQVLSDVSFSVDGGQTVALVGPNGSGKTTALKLLNGLLWPFQGQIDFLGEPLRKTGILRARCVYVHQHPVLFTGTVMDNIAYPLKLRRVPRNSIAGRVGQIAEKLGVTELLDRDAARLSGGETQRIAVARALVAGADVLLLDEPTSSLDHDSQKAFRQLLAGLRHDGDRKSVV